MLTILIIFSTITMITSGVFLGEKKPFWLYLCGCLIGSLLMSALVVEAKKVGVEEALKNVKIKYEVVTHSDSTKIEE